MLNLGKTRDHLTVVDDQIGSPTYTWDLARLLADMIETDRYGRYHATNEGLCSWYEFACEIFRQAGMPVEVEPVSSSQYPAKAGAAVQQPYGQVQIGPDGIPASAVLAGRPGTVFEGDSVEDSAGNGCFPEKERRMGIMGSEYRDRLAHWIRSLKQDFYTPEEEIRFSFCPAQGRQTLEEVRRQTFVPAEPGFAWGKNMDTGGSGRNLP